MANKNPSMQKRADFSKLSLWQNKRECECMHHGQTALWFAKV